MAVCKVAFDVAHVTPVLVGRGDRQAALVKRKLGPMW